MAIMLRDPKTGGYKTRGRRAMASKKKAVDLVSDVDSNTTTHWLTRIRSNVKWHVKPTGSLGFSSNIP